VHKISLALRGEAYIYLTERGTLLDPSVTVTQADVDFLFHETDAGRFILGFLVNLETENSDVTEFGNFLTLVQTVKSQHANSMQHRQEVLAWFKKTNVCEESVTMKMVEDLFYTAKAEGQTLEHLKYFQDSVASQRDVDASHAQTPLKIIIAFVTKEHALLVSECEACLDYLKNSNGSCELFSEVEGYTDVLDKDEIERLYEHTKLRSKTLTYIRMLNASRKKYSSITQLIVGLQNFNNS
jgi:hypothetical protein